MRCALRRRNGFPHLSVPVAAERERREGFFDSFVSRVRNEYCQTLKLVKQSNGKSGRRMLYLNFAFLFLSVLEHFRVERGIPPMTRSVVSQSGIPLSLLIGGPSLGFHSSLSCVCGSLFGRA